MQERMMSDRERVLIERDMYLSSKRSMLERQTIIVNLMPKLLIPIVFMLVAITLLDPAKNLMSQYERILTAEANGMERIPDLKKQITILEIQLAKLTSQSIESRLSNIEKSIAIGDVDVEEIATLQGLKADFEILKSYMFSDPEDLVKLKTLQRDYQEISRDIESYVHKDIVEREISYLTNMFYTVLAFLGILISIAGGSWYSTAKKLKTINNDSEKET
jgi:hypothetical protein